MIEKKDPNIHDKDKNQDNDNSNNNIIKENIEKNNIENKKSPDEKDTSEKISEIKAGSKTLQVILVVLFSFILLSILSKPFRSFKCTDEYPKIISITPQKIVQFGGFPSEIVSGILIKDLSHLDVTAQSIDADMTVWFRFDPKSISLNRIGQFSIDNAEIKYKSDPKTRAEGKLVVVTYDIKATFALNLDYKNFPFDDHMINLSITHYGLSPYEAIFESSKSNFVISNTIKLTGWKIIDKIVKTGFIENTLNEKIKASSRFHPKIVYSIALHRIGTRHFITIIIPLLIIFFVSVFTLAFDPTESTVGIAITSISAIIAQRFVIEDMSPKSTNLMISDKLFVIFLIISCMLFFISVFSSKIAATYKNIITIILYVFTLIAILYVISPFS